MFSIFLSNKKCRLEHVVNKLMSCLINEFLWILITNCREWISNFMDTPWNSITFHGTPSILQGTRWNSMELQGQSMEFHGITWTSVELHGIPWNSIDTPWNSMEIHGYSMELHGIPWNSMELHKYSMTLHGYSMELHGSSMEIHGIPWRYFTRAILGFHLTSPKFKLRNYRFFWVSTCMWYYSTLKPLYKKKNSVRKGSSFCDTGRFNFQAFAWRGS